jgi:hypothetical protein
MESTDKSPLITWDSGTAYDLFVSLRVLHEPDKFDLRASWAAGVRSRSLPATGKLWKPLEISSTFRWDGFTPCLPLKTPRRP